MSSESERYLRVISDQVRFGCGYLGAESARVYFAFHGQPSRNEDYFVTAEISEEEYDRINSEYTGVFSADREQAERFRIKYIEGHRVIMEGWDKLP